MKLLLLGLTLLTTFSVFANDGCIDCLDSRSDLNSVYKTFDNFCSNISSLKSEKFESDSMVRISKINEYQSLHRELKKIPKDKAQELLTKLQTLEHEFEDSIENRKKILESLSKKVKNLRNEIGNLQAAKASINLLDQYVNNKLCDGFFSEGTRRGVDICKDGQWTN